MLANLTFIINFAMLHLLVSAVLLLVVASVVKIFRASAETQSWLWSTVFLLATLLPFSLFIDLSQSLEPISSSQQLSAHLVESGVTPSSGQDSFDNQAKTYQVPAASVFDYIWLAYAALVIWLLGSGWRIYSVARSMWLTRHMRQAATPLNAIAMGWKFDVPIKQSTLAPTPLVVGIAHPQIILPQSFLQRFSPEQLLPILLHEKAHIDRRDLWMGFCQEVLAIVFWWNPLMRLINRKLHVAREMSCDLRAAKQLNNHKNYAQCLLDCTRLMLAEHQSAMAMGLFSKKKDLEERVMNVLSKPNLRSYNMFKIFSLCAMLAFGSYVAAQQYAPKVNIADVKRGAKHFSQLSQAQSEMLIEAVYNQDISLIELMLSNGLDINTPMSGDGTALIIAVKNKSMDMVQQLIAMGADVNQSSEGDGNPLIAAAEVNATGIAQRLLQEGADINAIVPGDETPLIKASWYAHYEMVELLVENGANVNLGVTVNSLRGEEYRTPLNKAGSDRVKDYLLAAGAVE